MFVVHSHSVKSDIPIILRDFIRDLEKHVRMLRRSSGEALHGHAIFSHVMSVFLQCKVARSTPPGHIELIVLRGPSLRGTRSTARSIKVK